MKTNIVKGDFKYLAQQYMSADGNKKRAISVTFKLGNVLF